MCKVSNAIPTFNEINLESLTNCDVCMCSKEIDRAVDKRLAEEKALQGQVEGFKGLGRGLKVQQAVGKRDCRCREERGLEE
jgi:hypothetical protein